MTTGVEQLAVEQLVVDPLQARDDGWRGDTDDQRLSASIARDGLLQPLVVRPLADGDHDRLDAPPDATHAIIAGARRYQAAMNAGHEAVACRVLPADDLAAAWASLLENTDRKALSEQERATQLAVIYELVRPLEPPEACPACETDVAGEPGLYSHYSATDCSPPPVTAAAPPPPPDAHDAAGGAPDAAGEAPDASGEPLDASGGVASSAGHREPDASGAATSSEGTLAPDREDGATSAGRRGVARRFRTTRQAYRYLAWRLYDRTDDQALERIRGHLRTAALPPTLQALFKPPDRRSQAEAATLAHHDIDTSATLGSGEGYSGTAREVAALHKAVADDLASDAIAPTTAVLEAVGTLRHAEMSEQELRRSLREFRHDVTSALEASAAAAAQRQQFTETLQASAPRHAARGDLNSARPFRKVDVMGPADQRHSRWHAQAMAHRNITAHGELVRELYQERLETLAHEEGWD